MADALEQALHDLAAAMDTGPVPDVAPAVLSRLREPPRVERRRPWLRIAIAALVLAVAAALVPDVRSAVADFVHDIPGVLFNTSEKHAPPVPSAPRRLDGSLGGPLGLTHPVALEAARSAVSFPVVVPQSLGPPDEVYLRGDRAVTMLWRARSGFPALTGTQVGVMIDVLDPESAPLLEKLLYGVAAERLVIDGHEARWIAARHPLLVLDANGIPIEQREAAQTLVIDAGRVTVRIESDLSRDGAVGVARSLQ
ncbi:MAG TPA: hypothetical protein VGL39_12010 [Jatrophihabitantaceae bacterium]